MQDFFRLRLLLNRTNLVRNQKTEIEFRIIKTADQDYRLIATLKGIANPKKIELCRAALRGRWLSSEVSGLTALEDFCVDYFRRNGKSAFAEPDLNTLANELLAVLSKLGIPN